MDQEQERTQQVSAMLNSTIEPEPGYRIFVNNMNTYLGRNIIEKLRNDKEVVDERSSHFFIGTLKQDKIDPNQKRNDQDTELPSVVLKTLSAQRTREFREHILDCDVIVYDIIHSKPEQIDYVIKTLKTADLKGSEKRKTLILISSVMTWAQTPPKLKKKQAEDDAADDGGDPDNTQEQEVQSVDSEEEQQPEASQEPELDQDGNPIHPPDPRKQWRFLKQTDYYLRVPDPNFEHIKSIETLGLSMLKTQPNVDVYILCAGMIYGQGEIGLYQHFKAAWLQNPCALPVLGDGNNFVPTIHVADLASLVKKVMVKVPKDQHYLLAIDRTKNTTQKNLIQGISDGIGAGKCEEILDQQKKASFLRQQWAKMLQLDLKMKPSSLLKDDLPPQDDDLAGGGGDDEDQEAKQAELERQRKFPWHCEKGVVQNIEVLNQEFNTVRGLKPVKVYITGPPACGKTHFAKKLAKYYNVPHIRIKQTIQQIMEQINKFKDAQQLPNPLFKQVKEKVDALREQIIQKMEEDKDPDDTDATQIDPSTVHVQIPEKLIYKIMKWKLQKNDCRNRGFILDGYPRVYKDAQYMFLKKPKKVAEDGDQADQDEEDQDDGDGDEQQGKSKDFSGYTKDDLISPSSVIQLQADDQSILNRLMQLQESDIQGTHHNQVDTIRRLKQYRAANQNKIGEPSVTDFFRQNAGVQVFSHDVNQQQSDDNNDDQNCIEACKIYIERLGKPINYMTTDEQDEKSRVEKLKQRQQNEYAKIEKQKAIQERVEHILRQQREQHLKQRLQQIREQEKEQVESKSLNLINYFNDNVMSILADGLFEVCKATPEDPLEFLAKYLFKRALDVPDPDPWNYK